MIKKINLPVAIVHGGSVTTADSSNSKVLNGKITGLVVDAPQYDGSTTYTVTLTEVDTGYTLYTKASLTENSKTALIVDANNYPLQIPVSGKIKATITTSNNQTTTDTTTNVYVLLDGQVF